MRRPATPTGQRPLVWLGTATALLVLAAFLVVATRGNGTEPLDSVAILPVVNLSGDPGQEYFVDGMTDLLIHRLAQLDALDRVIARSSVMRYKGSTKTPQEIGREIGVGALVEASMVRDGDRVRINAALVEAESGRTLWSRSFERQLRDVLALQRDVAREIAESVGGTLQPHDRARLAAAPPVDPEAFDLYVRGTQARHKVSLDGSREAVGYFTRALAEDSTYAPIHAGLASALAFLGDEDRARASVEAALTLDPSLAEAHVALGLIRQFYDLDLRGAGEAIQEARRLSPGYAEAHHELGMVLMRLGRPDEALSAAQRALYLSPLSARYQSGVGEVLLAAGRYREALAVSDSALALDATYKAANQTKVVALAMLGRYAEAEEAWERCAPSGCLDGMNGTPGYVYAASGQRTLALDELEELEAAWRDARGPGFHSAAFYAYYIAQVYAGLGDGERALYWLEQATTSDFALIGLGVDPVFRELRDAPRFRALLRRTGLPTKAPDDGER